MIIQESNKFIVNQTFFNVIPFAEDIFYENNSKHRIKKSNIYYCRKRIPKPRPDAELATEKQTRNTPSKNTIIIRVKITL